MESRIQTGRGFKNFVHRTYCIVLLKIQSYVPHILGHSSRSYVAEQKGEFTTNDDVIIETGESVNIWRLRECKSSLSIKQTL